MRYGDLVVFLRPLLMTMLLSSTSYAAIERRIDVTPQVGVTKDLTKNDLVMMLRLPEANRRETVEKHGSNAYPLLKQVSFDSNQTLQLRWRAMVIMGQVFPHQAQRDLLSALRSPEWFMRNAAIIALSHGNKKVATRWAVRLLDDDALVVRTAAVQALNRLNAREIEPILWTKLSDAKNFKNGKSLWVRKHIAETLAKFARNGQEAKFIQLLDDADPRVYPAAIRALEGITGQQLSNSKSILEQKQSWLAWWQTR